VTVLTIIAGYVTSEFGTEAAEAYKNKVVDSWSKETISVAIVWGAKTYILFDASIFQPVPGSRALESYNGWDGQPLGVESLPVGIPTDGIKTLGNVCTNYVESLLETASFLHVASSRNDSTLSSLILEVVSRFYEASTTASDDKIISSTTTDFRSEKSPLARLTPPLPRDSSHEPSFRPHNALGRPSASQTRCHT